MNKFTEPIRVAYPEGNKPIFEEWFSENYKGCDTDRELLPIFPTSFHVNNGYGSSTQELQDYCDKLNISKKYFGICQYDDGFMIDWKGKNVLEFNMSKKIGVQIPLLCRPHPFKFKEGKKWFANFIGLKTHQIRDKANLLKQYSDYYISFDFHDIFNYCNVINESIFTLCYRGYGANSFRIAEAVQYGSIPVYISDEHIIPNWMNFEDFGVIVKSEDADNVYNILQSIPLDEIIRKQDNLSRSYEKFYTYESNFIHIINYLESGA